MARINGGNASTSTATSGGTTSPGGNNYNVQFNSSGAFAGNNNFNFDGTNVNLIGSISVKTINISGGTSAQFLKADGSTDSSTYYKSGNTVFFSGLTDSSLTASQAVMTDANKKLVSQDYLNQAVKTTSSPTFANITDNGLTASKFVFTSAGKVLSSSAPSNIINDILPSQAGANGCFLKSNGTSVLWDTVSAPGCVDNMEWKGTWDSSTAYEVNDVVIHDCDYGGARIFLSLTCGYCGYNPNCECETSPSNWQLLTRNILSEDPSSCVGLNNACPTCYHYGNSGDDFLGTPDKWLRYYYYGSCEGEYAIPLYRVSS